MSEREAENTIFVLRKKANLYLQAGDTEAVERIQTTIARLQEIYCVTKGVERTKDNDRAA
jgi:hypothetical protein